MFGDEAPTITTEVRKMARAPKTEWSALTRAQLVAALARKGLARDDARASANVATRAGWDKLTSTDGTVTAVISYGDTETDAWDAQLTPTADLARLTGRVAMVRATRAGSNYTSEILTPVERLDSFPGNVSVLPLETLSSIKLVSVAQHAGAMQLWTPARARKVSTPAQARADMRTAHAVATPRLKPAQRDTRYPTGSWVWHPTMYVYAEVLRTPDTREDTVTLYVPEVGACDEDGNATGVIEPARLMIVAKRDVMPGANVGRGLSDLGKANVVYAVRPDVPTVDDLFEALRGNPWEGYRDVELMPGWVCETCAYAINYAEWPGDWSVTEVAERAAQVAEATEDARVSFIVDLDRVDTLREDGCAYHGARYVGTMYPVSMSRRVLL